MIGAAGTLCQFIDAIGYKPMELRLQCHHFQSVGFGCLIGDDEKPEDLSLIRFKLPVAKPPAYDRGQGRKKAERDANIVKILLKLVNKTLVATGKISGNARMNRQKRIFIIGIGASI